MFTDIYLHTHELSHVHASINPIFYSPGPSCTTCGSLTQHGSHSTQHSAQQQACPLPLQAVNHPYLVVHSANAPSTAAASSSAAASGAEGTCNLCHDPLEDGLAAGCGHAFCRACLREYLESAESGAEAVCTACSKPLTVDLATAPLVTHLPS